MSSFPDRLDQVTYLLASGNRQSEIKETFASATVADLRQLDSARRRTLATHLDRLLSHPDALQPLLGTLRSASPDDIELRRMYVWTQFRLGQIAVDATEFSSLFAPHLVHDPERALAAAKAAASAEQFPLVRAYLVRVGAESDDVALLAKAGTLWRKIQDKEGLADGMLPLRVALLGGMSTMYLRSALDACALARGMTLSIYEAEYNTIEIELLDPSSRLHAFRPEVVMLLPIQEHLETDSEHFQERELGRWRSLWTVVATTLRARVVQLLFEEDSGEENLFLKRNHPQARRALVRGLNDKLVEASPEGVTFLDYEAIIAHYGRENWVNRKTWHLAKQPVAMRFVGRLARHLVAAVAGQYGRSKRCLAVDLDNTLWGGVLGEDDIHGVRTGQGDGESEAFLEFQRYLLEQSRLGCILTIVSKNDESLVRELFEKRGSDLLVRWDDFAAHRVNWIDKAENLRSLSKELSLPLEHFVFVDDNPTERELIRQMLPDVVVPELPLDVGGYRRAIEKHLLFERSALTQEDMLRKDSYRTERQRQELQSQAGSLDDYLASLQMELESKKLDATVLERAAQLVSKTNQFNVTTIRYSAAELREMSESAGVIPLFYRLSDRFGDYGWIGLLILRREGETARIDTWLMSCRVLGKSVEACMLEDAASAARAWGCTTITGRYVRTKKNGMVADLFDRYGFAATSRTDEAAEYTIAIPSQSSDSTKHVRRKQHGPQ